MGRTAWLYDLFERGDFHELRLQVFAFGLGDVVGLQSDVAMNDESYHQQGSNTLPLSKYSLSLKSSTIHLLSLWIYLVLNNAVLVLPLPDAKTYPQYTTLDAG